MRVPENPDNRGRNNSIASFCFGLARRQYRQAVYRFPPTVAHQRSDPYSPHYHQHRARPCRQGHAASCRTRSSDGHSQSWPGLSAARTFLFAGFGPRRRSHDLPDELRLLLCLPAASQDGCRSDWCSLCNAPFCLDAPTISANLLRIRFDTIRRGRFRISHVGFGKSMLVFSWAVADALESTITIRRPRLILIGTDNFFSVFVLSGCPTRLADVYK
jgi:hypothetical protein